MRRVKSWIGVFAAMAMGLPSAARANPEDLAIAVEATYLARLAHFIVWPAAAFGNHSAPVTICIQGIDPFGPLLDRLVADQRVGERAITVRRVPRLESRAGCQLAYIGGGPTQTPAQALEAINDAPVVTVTDERRGPNPHGVIHFVEDGPRLRFAVDVDKAEQSGISISSKLLALALTVKR